MLRVARGPLPRLVLATFLTVMLAGTLPAHAEPEPSADLPSGFTDGVPVGGESGQGERGQGAGTAGAPRSAPAPAAAAAVTQRYFGSDPWHAIEASAHSTVRSCTVS